MKINIIYSLFFLLLTFSCRWDKADEHYISTTEYCNKYAGDKLMKVDIKEVEYHGKMHKRHREGIYDYEFNGDYTLKEFFLENGKRILDKIEKNSAHSWMYLSYSNGKDTTLYHFIRYNDAKEAIYEKRMSKLSIPKMGVDINEDYETYTTYDSINNYVKRITYNYVEGDTLESYTFFDISYEEACRKSGEHKRNKEIICVFKETNNDTIIEKVFKNDTISSISKIWYTDNFRWSMKLDEKGELFEEEKHYRQNDLDIIEFRYPDGMSKKEISRNGKEIKVETLGDGYKETEEWEYDSKGNVTKKTTKVEFLKINNI